MVDIGLELLRPAIEHLAHAYRHGVHQMGAPGFDIGVNFDRLALDNLHQMAQRRQQLLVQAQCSADMDGGRDNVVAALPAVDVIVGVHRLAQQPRGQGGNHFIGIHVGTGARAGLENIHRKVLHIIAGQQDLCRFDNGLALGRRDLLELDVGLGCGGFGEDQRADELRRHALMADREVVDRTLGLRAV